jgi:UDP-GlcNAc:undecaprenyl-phosphate/decaprenyl-phosphate GlcNAc-1-phosphate transferase
LSLAEAGLLSAAFLAPLLVVLVGMPPFLGYLRRTGRVDDDAHKTPPTKVPTPAGPVLFVGVLVGEAVAYLAFGSLVPLAVLGSAAVAFAVGLADDLYVLGGKTKPLLLLLASAPLVGLVLLQSDLYVPVLTFPILGDTSPHFTIYTLLAVAAFPVVANAFNMMDSFNGQISWFTVLTSLALLFGVAMKAFYFGGFSEARLASTLPLLAVAAGLLVFNRYPSRAFDGDSGALMFGAMFAALAITDGVEVAAMIAIVPAILNSFYTLSSVRGFVERRRMAARPTYVGEDGMLHATADPNSPTTLVRLILLAGPLPEKDLVGSVVALTVVACLLSAGISLLTWVH